MTFGGDKKTQWYEKLADPNVPLHEITQVSHGTKNADGIEILYANKLPVDRAFWYIRALGAIEIVCSPSVSSQSYLMMIASQK
jgi:hypothetical protein